MWSTVFPVSSWTCVLLYRSANPFVRYHFRCRSLSQSLSGESGSLDARSRVLPVPPREARESPPCIARVCVCVPANPQANKAHDCH